MSDTPRTDKAVSQSFDTGFDYRPLRDESRKLERENAALREAAPKIKAAVSEQLQAALSGLDLSLRYTDNPNRPNGFIRWGLVEKRIYEAVDAALARKEAQP